jgi:hypothetical protein
MVLGKLVIYMQETETRPYLSSCTKINSKCIKDLTVRSKIPKLLKEKNKTPKDA